MLSAIEAANMLGVAARTMYGLAAPSGPLPCYRIGRSIKFEESDVLHYKDTCRRVPLAPMSSKQFVSTTLPASGNSELRAHFLALGIKPKPPRSIENDG